MPNPFRPSLTPSSKKSFLPTILVLIVLVVYLVTNYFQESSDISTLREDMRTIQKTLSDRLDEQGKNIDHYTQQVTKIGQDLEAEKEHTQELETHSKLDHDEQLLTTDNLKLKVDALTQTLNDQAARLGDLAQVQTKQDEQAKNLKKMDSQITEILNHIDLKDTGTSPNSSSSSLLPLPTATKATPADTDDDEGGHAVAVDPKKKKS